MGFQYGKAKLSDFGPWERAKILLIGKRIKERHGNAVYFYKIYKLRKILIKKEVYEDRY